MARLRFGGKGLPDGHSTWYDHINPDGTPGGQIFVRPGATVDTDRMSETEVKSFVDRDMAVIVDDAATAERS